MQTFMSGVGIACVIFTTGFLLSLGWFAGIRAAAYCFGPTHTDHNYNVHVKDNK